MNGTARRSLKITPTKRSTAWRRLAEGVDVLNIGGYTDQVARLVLLETVKGRDTARATID